MLGQTVLGQLVHHPLVLLLGWAISAGWFGELWGFSADLRALQGQLASVWEWHASKPDSADEVEERATSRRLQSEWAKGTWWGASSIHEAFPSCEIDQDGRGQCPRFDHFASSEAFQGKCIFVLDLKKDVREADRACGSIVGPGKRATPVQVESPEKNAVVARLCQEAYLQEHPEEESDYKVHVHQAIHYGCWIGLRKKAGTNDWYWHDGSVLGSKGSWQGYENWARHGDEGEEPDNDAYEQYEEHNDDREERVESKSEKGNKGDIEGEGDVACFMTAMDAQGDDIGWLIFAIIFFIVGLLAPSVASVIFAWSYKKSVTNSRPTYPALQNISGDLNLGPQSVFKHGACNTWCCHDFDMCLHGFCCTGARAADSHTAAGTGSYWSIFWVFEGAFLLGQFIDIFDTFIFGGWDLEIGRYIGGLIVAAFMTSKRAKLREKHGGPPRNIEDCLCWWCCSPCLTCQEAKHVDEVQGARVTCCCNFMQVQTVQAPMVGQATVVGQPGQMTVVGHPVPMANGAAQGMPIMDKLAQNQQNHAFHAVAVQAHPIPANQGQAVQCYPIQQAVVLQAPVRQPSPHGHTGQGQVAPST